MYSGATSSSASSRRLPPSPPTNWLASDGGSVATCAGGTHSLGKFAKIAS